MKIKEVVERTGLTDRAVRFYMENGLLFPFHKENWQGRRNYDFSEEDVARLSDIALLRSAGFSVEQIKKLLAGENPKEIIDERMSALKDSISMEEKTARALSSLQNMPGYDLSTLLDALKRGKQEIAGIPQSDSEPPYKRMYQKTKKRTIIFAIAAAGVLLLVLIFLGLAPYLRTGTASINVYENGKLLDAAQYTVASGKDSETGEYRSLWSGHGYYAISDYGIICGTITLYDDFPIDFYYFNYNNWHKVRFCIYIERDRDGVKKVTQVVWINGIKDEERVLIGDDRQGEALFSETVGWDETVAINDG